MKSVQIRSFFWYVFSRIRTEYGEIWSISPHSVRMRENTDQKNLRIWTLLMQWVKLENMWLVTSLNKFSYWSKFFPYIFLWFSFMNFIELQQIKGRDRLCCTFHYFFHPIANIEILAVWLMWRAHLYTQSMGIIEGTYGNT